jgi:predicted heme/steroid binding protein
MLKSPGVFQMKINRIFKIVVFSCLSLILLSFNGLIAAQSERAFTIEELAKYNGQNGAPSYVAVNGIVYDLTSVPEWANGRHFCSGAIAGKDLTFLWNLVPRSHKNPNFLKRFTVVGRLVTTKQQPSVSKPQPLITPSPSVPGGSTIFKPIILGLVIAIIITLVWLFLRLHKKKI